VSWLEILVIIGVIGFVIYQQIAGQKVQGKRLVVLPAVLIIVGFLGRTTSPSAKQRSSA
jgi:hypothetical protein